jgi:hypothetical protein
MSRLRSHSLRVAVASSLVAAAAILLATPAGAEPGFARVQAMPKTIGISTASGYNAISCPTTTECTAAGPYQSSDLPTVVTETSGAWGTPHELVPPFGASTGGRSPILTSISCAAAGMCEAVGLYAVMSTGAELPMLFTETSGTWGTVATLPNPTNVQLGSSEVIEPTAIDCPSTGNCVVVGAYRGSDGGVHEFADTQTGGGAYTTVQLPDVGGSSSSTLAVVSSLSCSDTSDCTAVGEEIDQSSFQIGTAAWTESSGTWATPTVVPTTTGSGFAFFIGNSVACPDATTCIAVGDELSYGPTGGSDLAAYAVEKSGVWSKAVAFRSPSLYPLAGAAELTGISCDAASLCEAVGVFAGSARTGLEAAGAATWSNGKWSSFGYVRGVPAGGRPATIAALLAVSCPSTTPCTGVGISSNATHKHPNNVVYAFSAQLVTARAITLPHAPVAVTGHGIAGGVQAEWQPPVDDGGAPVRSFTARAVPGGATCTTTHVTCALHGLRNGHRYRVIVSDRTSFGRSHATVGSVVLAGAAPSEPKGVHVSLRGNHLVISWRPSTTPRGEPVHYAVGVLGPRHFARAVGTRRSSVTIVVKTTGTYLITVAAKNESGTSKRAKVDFTPVVNLPTTAAARPSATGSRDPGAQFVQHGLGLPRTRADQVVGLLQAAPV